MKRNLKYKDMEEVRKMDKKVELYHGSGQKVEFPEIRKTRYTKDFSWGFYCTKSYEQAYRWAERKHKHGIINVYSYTENKQLKIKKFDQMCDEWLDFIIDCRSGKPHQYDIVIGAMANDQIYNYVSDYMEGAITKEQFWILAKFKYPTHQINFCTNEALKCLEYREAEEVV